MHGFPPIPLLYAYMGECQEKNIQLKVNSIQPTPNANDSHSRLRMRMILIRALRLSAPLRRSG